jgi:hypothetical protein
MNPKSPPIGLTINRFAGMTSAVEFPVGTAIAHPKPALQERAISRIESEFLASCEAHGQRIETVTGAAGYPDLA